MENQQNQIPAAGVRRTYEMREHELAGKLESKRDFYTYLKVHK